MKLHTPITLAAAADLLSCDFAGDPGHLIFGINEIHRVEAGDLTFVDVEKYFKVALNSKATTILINKSIDPPAGKGLLISTQPFHDYNRLTEHFQPRMPMNQGLPLVSLDGVKVGRNVMVGENVSIAPGCEIGHNAVIGSNVTIGKNTLLYPNVTICDHVSIGHDCCINAGTVIGSEAFYFKSTPTEKFKMLTKGRVVIGNHVDIGANCTIDRGVSADTEIGDYTKLDNLVQVGHDVIIGKRCIIAAQVGIAGVVTLEDDVKLWGQVGVSPDLTIKKGAELFGKTGVMSDLEGGQKDGGLVADTAANFLRKEAALKRLVKILPALEQLIK